MSDHPRAAQSRTAGKGSAKDDEDQQPAGAGAAMSKADMKKLLLRAQREPVNCAITRGASEAGAPGLILLDKVRPPKTLAEDLKQQFPGARKACFGTVSVDPSQTPKVAVFTVNKPPAGLDRKLVKALRGTGFKKVQIEKAGPDNGDGE